MTSGDRIQDIAAFDIQPINSENLSEKVLGYYLITTATIRVEDSPRNQNETLVDEASVKKKIKNIAAHLSQSDNSQLTIAIHGYANSQSNARSRHQKIYNDAKIFALQILFLSVIVGRLKIQLKMTVNQVKLGRLHFGIRLALLFNPYPLCY